MKRKTRRFLKDILDRARAWWYWNRPVSFRRLSRCVSDAVATTRSEEREKRRLGERRGAAVALALLSAFLALPAQAQSYDWKAADGVPCHARGVHVWCEDGFSMPFGWNASSATRHGDFYGPKGPRVARAQEVPPPAPPETPAPGFADTQAGAMAPELKPSKVWSATFEAGPSSVSTPEELKPYASLRATVSGEPWLRVRVFAQGRADRTPDGSAFSLDAFKSFRSAEALVGGLYRLKNSPVSVGAVGSLSWSLENEFKGFRDPNLWSFGGVVALERFAWWPDGGLAVLGVGRWAGRDGVRLSVVQPLKGDVALTVDGDVPFRKLPEFLRALPGAATAAPLTGAPPTPEQLAGITQKLPLSVKVGVLVRVKGFSF